jgi:Arm DNA-binding domain
MDRQSLSGGVRPAGSAHIQFTFQFGVVRYRPTLLRAPTEANLRRAREQLAEIKARFTAGTFSFAEEFPNYTDSERPRTPCLKRQIGGERGIVRGCAARPSPPLPRRLVEPLSMFSGSNPIATTAGGRRFQCGSSSKKLAGERAMIS